MPPCFTFQTYHIPKAVTESDALTQGKNIGDIMKADYRPLLVFLLMIAASAVPAAMGHLRTNPKRGDLAGGSGRDVRGKGSVGLAITAPLEWNPRGRILEEEKEKNEKNEADGIIDEGPESEGTGDQKDGMGEKTSWKYKLVHWSLQKIWHGVFKEIGIVP